MLQQARLEELSFDAHGVIQQPVLPQIQVLKRDLREASVRLLGQREVRYLVDSYYEKQEARKAEKMRFDALQSSGEPNACMEWVFNNSRTAENEIRKQLKYYVENETTGMGTWCIGIHGIAEVITAGLLAHIDITGLKGASSIWRYCGLDPTIKWYSKKDSAKIVSEIMKKVGTKKVNDEVIAVLAQETTKKSEQLYKWAIEYSKSGSKFGDLVKEIQIELGLDAAVVTDEVITQVATRSGTSIEDLPKALTSSSKELFDKTPTAASLAKSLSRRPWNDSMKLLAFKIGDSMVKNCNSPKCYYGHLYKTKRAYYEAKSLAGDYADQAAGYLKAKDFGHETVSYKYYMKGELPPSQIVARARRWTSKLFLSHFFEESYRRMNKEEPPLPYAIAFGGHVHAIKPPNPDYYAPQPKSDEYLQDDINDWDEDELED